MFKAINVFILQLIIFLSVSATTYYVSPLGDNAYNGKSEDKPFKVVRYAINQMTVGDTLIVLDGFYTGTLKLKSGITIRAKNPRKVIFSGAEPLRTKFEKHSDNIYRTPVDQEIKQVFFNDMPMLWAQWPNIHWTENWETDKKWVKSGDGSDQGVFTCSEFNEISDLDLVGGYCFLRYGKGNSCYSRLIEAFDGDRLFWNTERFFSKNYAGEDGYKGTAPNSEFFLAGAFDLLDVPGEWIVKDGYLYLFPPAGTDPNDAVILAKTNDFCIYQEEAVSDITIDGIDILASSVRFAAPGNVNISFHDVYFTYIGEELLYINRPEGAEIDKPIYAEGSDISFEKCLFAGGKNSALKLSGSEIRIENCVFMENNRHANFESRPVVLTASGTYKITRNIFYNNCSDAMRIIHDADYVTSAPQEVSYNNICNAGKYNVDVSGIYMPTKSQFYTNVHHNWIHNVKGNAFRLDKAGIELNLHHNVFWESKRGINVEGFEYFNIYNNTSFHHHASDVLMKNITDQNWYPDASHDSTFAPIEDWNVINNLVENFEDAVGPTEKDLLNAQKELGLLHPERMENFNIPVRNRGTIQGNIIGNYRHLYTNSNLSGLNLVPNDTSIRGGVEQSPELEAQGITSLDSFRGAYDVNGEYWYPGSDWMPYGLQVVTTMAEAEAFAKEYYAVSIMPEINVQNLPMGYLQYPFANNIGLASITWPDYKEHGEFAGWEDLRQDTLPEFAPDRYHYTIDLPASYKKVPALTATLQVPSARLIVDRATSLAGTLKERTTTFTISPAFDTTLQTTYKVVFELIGAGQAVNSKPFISEMILGRHNHDDYIEIYNPNNETDSLDMSRYLVLNAPVASSESEVFEGFQGIAADSSGIHYCYVPGYKYNLDANSNWANGIEGGIIPDDNVNSNVATGDVFLIGSYGSSLSGSADLEVVLQGGATDNIVDVNLINNPNFPNAVQGKNVLDYRLSRALFLYKIVNDSILDGTKGIWESLEDYELIDRVQWDETIMGNIIAGVVLRNGSALIRKPYVQSGVLLANSGFHADADSSCWIHYSRNINTPEEWKKVGTTMGENLGFHNADDFTAHISTVTSSVYQIDPGFEADLHIIGDMSGTTVAGFIDNLVKANDLQLITVKDTGGEKADDAIMASGDSVIVVSANGLNQTTYVVESRLLNSNTAFTTVDDSGIIVDNVNLILSGFDHTTTIAEVLNGVRCDTTAYINVIDANDRLVPLLTSSLDTSVTEPLVTRVYTGVFFEVVAEDGSTASYALLPYASASDAFLTSDVFTVDQQEKSITGATIEYAVAGFMPYLHPSGNAGMKLKNSVGFERVAGLLQSGDYVMVTSEDKTDSTKYDINLYGDSLRYLTIKRGIFIRSTPLKKAKVGNTYSYTIKTSGSGTLSYESFPQAGWLSLSGGILSGTPQGADEGTLGIRITYANEEDTTVQEYTLTVIPDIPLAITSIPVERALVGETYSYTITTTGTGTLSFDKDVADEWIEWLSLEGNTLTGTPAIGDVGSIEAAITFENELERTTQTFTLTVYESLPLAITSTPVDSAIVGEAYVYSVETTGEGSLSFTTSPQASWLSLNGSVLSGTPEASDTGKVTVSILFTDGADKAEQAFSITIVYKVSSISKARADQIVIWPNPAYDHIQVSKLPFGATIELINSSGSVIANYKSVDEQLILPISRIAPGTYLLRIVEGMNVITAKLIINQ